MPIPLLILQIVTLLVLLVLLFRKPAAPPANVRLEQLPDQITRLEEQLRASFAETRSELRSELALNRQQAEAAAGALRTEITQSISTLGQTLKTDLNSFREDNTAAAERLRNDVEQRMRSISQGFTELKEETSRKHTTLQESLNNKLVELMGSNATHQDKLRATVEERLDKLNTTNAAKLEEMRVTVDEKLHATLQSRLTESFGQVTTHLGEVQKGLGEMKELATGVGDLKKVLSNVKSRGVVGEFQLGMQLEQMFSPDQYIKNARIKPDTQEMVEYALKFPNGDGDTHTLLAIDAKFPKEDWERLEHAYETGTSEEIIAAGRAFERSIRAEGKRICDKYIDPPTTMPHAIMFLPTENLYAEVVRRPGLLSEIQANCRVTIAGPSTFMAILTSFQMGFHTLAIQKKGDEVWRVLSSAKNEFDKFGGLMDKVEKQVGTVQNTLRELGGKTKTINRALKNVSSIDSGTATTPLIGFEEIAGVAPLLAAASEDD